MLQIVGATADLEDSLYEESAAAGLLLYEGDNQAVSLATLDALDEIVARFETALARVAVGTDSVEANTISPARQFRAAFNMIDGATDAVPAGQAIRWVERML